MLATCPACANGQNEPEVNTGNGMKFPKWIRNYMTFVLPVIILALMVYSIVGKFI